MSVLLALTFLIAPFPKQKNKNTSAAPSYNVEVVDESMLNYVTISTDGNVLSGEYIKNLDTNEDGKFDTSYIFANRSVGSIVNENYAAARIFKSFGIDFCCGGSAMLADACRTAGVEIEKVCEALDKNEATKCDSIPFASWPTDLLIDYVLKIVYNIIRQRG